MEKKLKFSPETLKRLPIYLRILKEHSEEEYISSTKISSNLKIGSIQVRKDLSKISSSGGVSKKGFKTSELITSIENFMGLKNSRDAILVGAGKLGQALVHFSGFEHDTKIVFAFDNDKEKCDNKKIFHVDEMPNILKGKNIKIGIITTPKEVAQEVCDKLLSCGIKAIWNFAPTTLKVPNNIVVKNEDLSVSLLVLAKQLEL